jgi:hypothetical protein
MEEKQKELTKILGINNGLINSSVGSVTWEEIFTQIGRLLERANKESPTCNLPHYPAYTTTGGANISAKCSVCGEVLGNYNHFCTGYRVTC